MKIILDEGYNAMCDFVYLGYVGEVNARKISVLNYAIPEATAYKLKVEYPDKTVYELPIKNGICSLGASIFKIACEVKCQIVAYAVEGKVYKLVRKSDIFKQEIRNSIDESGIPSYEESLDALDKILQYESNSREYAERAEAAAIKSEESEGKSTLSASNASNSEQAAKTSEENAKQYSEDAKTYSLNAKSSEDNAKVSEKNAQTYSESAKRFSEIASTSSQNAENAKDSANTYANNAKASASAAKLSETNASKSETATAGYAQTAKTNADSTTADRQAVQDMAEQVTADKATVADNAAQVATDRKAAETAAQTAQAVAKKVDSSISDLEKIDKNFLVKSKNMLNLETLTVNAWISNTSGNVQPYDNWSSTDYIPIDDLTSIFFVSEKNGVYEFVGGNFGAFYDEQKRYISGFSGVVLENTLIPQKAKYIRISNKSLLFIKSVKPIISSIDIWNPVPTPEEYEGCGEVRFNDSENVLPNAYEAIKKNTVEIGRLKANVDFLAMLNGVELEVSGGEASYAKVKRYYDSRLWSAVMVHAAVGKWITAEEYEMITKEVYHETEVIKAH